MLIPSLGEEPGWRGFALPQTGLAGWLLADNWLNVLAYGGTALLLVALTRGRLGVTQKP